jgi:hypothetical protein
MYRTKLHASKRLNYAQFRLPNHYRSLSVESITVVDREPPRGRDYLVHLAIIDLLDRLRLEVTTEPHPRRWSPFRRRSYPLRLSPEGEPVFTFAEQFGQLRYSTTPKLLRGVNSKISLDLLGASPRHYKQPDLPAYRPDAFTWVPPQGPYDLRSRAYREIERSHIVEKTRAFGPIDLLNMLLVYAVPIRHASVDVNFR